MTVNELLGLPADATQGQIAERTMQLVQNEKDLLEVTGKDTVAAAMGVVIAQKESATELDKARAAVKEWEDQARADESAALKREIEGVVKGAIHDGRISIKDVERQAQLVKHGEKFGIESLRETVAMMSPRPVRQFQAVTPGNSVAAQMAAIEQFKKSNPGATTADAYVALSKSNPALFSEEA
jgi:hypothetical protein